MLPYHVNDALLWPERHTALNTQKPKILEILNTFRGISGTLPSVTQNITFLNLKYKQKDLIVRTVQHIRRNSKSVVMQGDKCAEENCTETYPTYIVWITM